MNEKYARKYQLLKKRIKDLIYENAALCDQVDFVQVNTTKAIEDRKFLKKQLLQYEPDHDGGMEKRRYIRKQGQNQLVVDAKPSRQQPQGNNLEFPATKVKSEKPSTANDNSNIEEEEGPIDVDLNPSQTNLNGNSYAIDNLVIQSLGEIHPQKPNFHNENWIYPIGFTSIRIFGSMKNPFQKSVYTCRINEVGDHPRFEMSSEADPEVMIVGPSSQFCHMTLLQHLQETHGLEQLAGVQPSGDWFFGLAHPVVMSLMKRMPKFNSCAKFKEFKKCHEATIAEKESDPGINYEAFHKLISQQQSNDLFIFNQDDEMKQEDVDQ